MLAERTIEANEESCVSGSDVQNNACFTSWEIFMTHADLVVKQCFFWRVAFCLGERPWQQWCRGPFTLAIFGAISNRPCQTTGDSNRRGIASGLPRNRTWNRSKNRQCKRTLTWKRWIWKWYEVVLFSTNNFWAWHSRFFLSMRLQATSSRGRTYLFVQSIRSLVEIENF